MGKEWMDNRPHKDWSIDSSQWKWATPLEIVRWARSIGIYAKCDVDLTTQEIYVELDGHRFTDPWDACAFINDREES